LSGFWWIERGERKRLGEHATLPSQTLSPCSCGGLKCPTLERELVGSWKERIRRGIFRKGGGERF